MRLAVSGTHCSGKSTLIESFLLRHRDSVHEQEAYDTLEESFSAEPSAEDFFRQLEYQIERLRKYERSDLVIFERSPADYVAYLKAILDLRRHSADRKLLEHAIELATDAMSCLDLIFYLPAFDVDQVSEEEDLPLRSAVDDRLAAILLNNELDLFNRHQPVVIEVSGSNPERLRIVDSAIAELSQ
jgi:hypothetical protein